MTRALMRFCGVAVTVAAVGLPLGAQARAAGLPSLGLPPVNELPPSIAGSAVAGSTVTCSPGQWLNSPTSFLYSWQSDLITTLSSDSPSNQYQLTPADVGALITCTVTATNTAGSTPAVSTPVTPVSAPIDTVPLDQSLPTISGTPDEGQALSCSPGAWSNSPTSYTYTWQRNASNIDGAASDQYTLTSNDVNELITCTVVASNSSGSGVSAVSLPVVPATGSGSGSGGGTGGGSGGGTGGGSGGSTGSGSGAGSSTSTGTGTGSGRGAGTAALTAFSLSSSRVAVRVHRGRARTKGLKFRFTIDRPAEVVIVIERLRSGSGSAARCRAVSHRKTSKLPCAPSYVVAKTVTVSEAGAGGHSFEWGCRSAGRLVASGRYRAYAYALSSGHLSSPRQVAFTVVRKRS